MQKISPERARQLKAIMVMNGLTDKKIADATRYIDKYVNSIRNGKRAINAKNSRVIEYIESFEKKLKEAA
jgi:hypothetical protein